MKSDRLDSYHTQFLRGKGRQQATLDLGLHPPGVYLVQVRTIKGWVVKKVIRQ